MPIFPYFSHTGATVYSNQIYKQLEKEE